MGRANQTSLQRRRSDRRRVGRSDHQGLRQDRHDAAAGTRPVSTTAGRAMGDGILKAREMLVGSRRPNDHGYTRYGARPTMIRDDRRPDQPEAQRLVACRPPSTGRIGPTTTAMAWPTTRTSDNYKRYAFWEATEAIKRGITIHTIAVGAAGRPQLDEGDRLRRRRRVRRRAGALDRSRKSRSN